MELNLLLLIAEWQLLSGHTAAGACQAASHGLHRGAEVDELTLQAWEGVARLGREGDERRRWLILALPERNGCLQKSIKETN